MVFQYLSVIIIQLVDQDAVRCIYVNKTAVHDHLSVLDIKLEERHLVGFMVQRNKEFIAGKDLGILGIISRYGKKELLFKESVFSSAEKIATELSPATVVRIYL